VVLGALFDVATVGVILPLNNSTIVTRKVAKVRIVFHPTRLAAVNDSIEPLTVYFKIRYALVSNDVGGVLLKHLNAVVRNKVFLKKAHQPSFNGPMLLGDAGMDFGAEMLRVKKMHELK
jgi:hypothetical protein